MCLVQAFKHLVRDKKELEGLEPITLAVAAQKAAAEGHKGATAEAGPWLLTLDYSTYSAVVSFANNRDLREKMYRAYRRIGADAPSDNTDIIKQILKRRQQLAQMLGFKSYAEESFLSKVRNCWTQPRYPRCGFSLAQPGEGLPQLDSTIIPSDLKARM
jgi:oligopeptidase A